MQASCCRTEGVRSCKNRVMLCCFRPCCESGSVDMRSLASGCVWRFMWTPLMRARFAHTACLGSWILSSTCRAVAAPDVRLCAQLLAPLISWWAPSGHMRTPCPRAHVCSLLDSCVALCLLSRCRLHPLCLSVALSRSALLGVLRLKPSGVKRGPRLGFIFADACITVGRLTLRH
jgi:hypothetical protein